MPAWLELLSARTEEAGGGQGVGLLPSVCGILALGVADVLGVLVGKHLGKIAICRGSKKTVEGTAAAVVGTVAFALACNRASGGTLLDLERLSLAPTAAIAPLEGGFIGSGLNGPAAFAVLSASMCLLEAFTMQLDNIYVPLFFYVMLRVSTVAG